jgi:hypothetical protein
MRTKFFSVWLAVALLTGCASHETIHFQSDPVIPPPSEPAQKKSADGLAPETVREIERMVFGWMLEHPTEDEPQYSAIFLRTDEKQTARLMEQFPGHRPAIKQAWHLQLRSGQSPLDKDTGRAAVLLSVDVAEPENNQLEAIGTWSAGEASTVRHVFTLKKAGYGWAIQTVK